MGKNWVREIDDIEDNEERLGGIQKIKPREEKDEQKTKPKEKKRNSFSGNLRY